MKTDLSALKFNQVTVVALTSLALVLGAPLLALVLGTAMLLGALFPAHSPLRALYQALSPLLGLHPQVVDETPEAHHFAQGVGGVFLLASALASLAGLGLLGGVLAVAVIGLALLNLTTHVCVGCLLYFQYKMLGYRLNAARK